MDIIDASKSLANFRLSPDNMDSHRLPIPNARKNPPKVREPGFAKRNNGLEKKPTTTANVVAAAATALSI
ncbi:hypothetical protein [Sphingomonas sp. EC-HK361]|uniref:hypothetical protein n=1 Tax=Sphingomonas sp. EC-HK361 TaxID=2038397 RepID=UPI0018FE4FF4|nr:hypothetical protein [Sphingomonas sp. EC-HK361]